PGTQPDPSGFNELLGQPLNVLATEPNPTELDKPDFDNPFFENVFEERSVSIAMPRATRVLDWGIDRSALLRYKNDQPFLSRFNRQCWLYVIASPLKAGFTDFYNHAIFVPVMYRIAASSRKNENRLYHTLNEDFITLRIDSLPTDESLRLVGEQE